MLFDLESNKLQDGFRRLVSLGTSSLFNDGARLETDEGILDVRSYAPGIIRLRIDKTSSTDYGLITADSQSLKTTAHTSSEGVTFELGSLTLELRSSPLRLKLSSKDQTLLSSADDGTIMGDLRLHPFAYNGSEWLINFALRSDEAVYGLGEKFSGLNRRGQLVTSWNRDATGVNAEISYKNMPFAWSSAGWGIFVNTPAPVVHGVGYAPWSHRTYAIHIQDPNLDIFMLAAGTPAQMLERFTWLTGRSPLPPRWSYGMWMSRAYYQTADEILDVARKLRERCIPCDVLTLDGRAWHKPETRFDFSWDSDRYPDPASFVSQLREMGYKLCLWEYPYISVRSPIFGELDARKYFLSDSNGDTYIHRWFPPPNDSIIPHLQPSGIVDFTNPEAYAWYRDAHRSLFDAGVSVMKSDYGEAVPMDVKAWNGDDGRRLHNIYALLYNRCVYEASERYAPDGAVVWGRAGWTGSQRFPVQWGGDPQGDWEGLAASIRGGLSWGMSGVPFYTHDIGGLYGHESSSNFLAGGMPEPELYIRWAQAGIFSPMTRFHGTSPREPWVFGEAVEGLIRRWLGLRYRLIPYLQAAAIEAHRTGLPLMRAMPLAFPEDRPSWSFENQYMLGAAVLVAPVLQPGGRSGVYLPDGEWIDLWTGAQLEGRRYVDPKMPLDQIPLYGRVGETLMLGPKGQHTEELAGAVEAIRFGDQEFRLQI